MRGKFQHLDFPSQIPNTKPIQPTPPPSNQPSKTFLLILVGIVLMIVSGLGGYFLGAKNNQLNTPNANPILQVSPSATQEVPPTTFQKMSPPPDIKTEITTTHLKSIPLSSATGWNDVSFKGISFKIPPDLTFKDLQDSSNIGIIYKEGSVGGPNAISRSSRL